MHEDQSNCPSGLYVTFKYDYNLLRADLFSDHVGSVTLYIFDENGALVKTQTESNTATAAPLRDHNYQMHVTDLAPGKYRLIALAGQNSYDQQLATARAKFVRAELPQGARMTDLDVVLDHAQSPTPGLHQVPHNDLPLDTLWHGINYHDTEVSSQHETYDTISLVRDTKLIAISLREIDDPSNMDVADYQMAIFDRNHRIAYDNSVDESKVLGYTPYVTWNTEDRLPDEEATRSDVGRTAHAEFMTSRIIYHDNSADDGALVISHVDGTEVVNVNLPDMISRLRRAAHNSYTPQEFLDRGYDYQLDFYLKGGQLYYVNISISVLGWSYRYQIADLL